MTARARGPAVLLLLVVCAAGLAACGKKGPPLPPLARVPAAPGNPLAIRVGDEVYLRFTVPSANVSGQTPADVSAVDLYAFTGTAPPPGPDPLRQAVKIASFAVHVPVPAPPPPPEAPPVPPPAPRGFVQGEPAVVREVLTPEVRMPTPLQAAAAAVPGGTGPAEATPAPAPLLSPPGGSGLKRYYYLVAASPRGRASTPAAPLAVSLDEPSSPPAGLAIEYTEKTMTLRWQPPPDARRPPPAPDPALLPSKPLLPPPPPTTYHVFEVPREPAAPPDRYAVTMPAPLTPEPLAAPEFAVPGDVRFGQTRCFVVRAVDTLGGIVTLGRASEAACVTPVDTFPPEPPRQLAAIAGAGVINLIWEPNTEPDLAGYIVLRGPAAGGALQALTPVPIRETTYRDQMVRPGERYVYAVVAVDNATPQNISGQSNRVEESSRAPR